MLRVPLPRSAPVAVAFSLLFAAVASGSCSNQQQPETDQKVSAHSKLPPGTSRWEDGALLLPARSPVVGLARPDEILANARRLRSWLVEQPAMFGEEGETFVQRFRTAWNQLSKGLGGDPLSKNAPDRLGLAASRPVYLGVYPAAGTGESFVDHVETAVRESAELSEETSLGTALQEMRDGVRKVPSNLTRKVLDSVQSSSPRAGFRLAIPVRDVETFVGKLDALASFAGFRELPRGDEPWPGSAAAAGELESDDDDGAVVEPIGYVNAESRWPALLVRPGSKWVQVDVLFQIFDLETSQSSKSELVAEFRASLNDLVEEFGSGRPAAPKPAGAPAFSVSADQKRTSIFARMQAYKRVLDTVPQVAVDRRNRALVSRLTHAVQIGENWRLGSDALTGLSYSFTGRSGGDSDRLFQTEMTLYGPSPPERPILTPVDAGLGIDRRAFGLSISLDPLFDKRWKSWLGVDNPSEIVGNSEIAETNPALYLLSLPRNLALFLVNVETIVEPSIPESLAALYRRRKHLQRLEIATAGLDPSALRRRPRLVGLLTFAPGAQKSDVEQTIQAIPPFAEFLFEIGDARIAGTRRSTPDVPDDVEIGELRAVGLPKSHPAHPTHYFAHVSAERSFLFFSHGISEKAAREELDALRKQKGAARTEEAFLGRLEPATAVAALTAFDPDAFDPIAPGILAQRIGPMVLTIHPNRRDGVQMLRYRFELKAPPEL